MVVMETSVGGGSGSYSGGGFEVMATMVLDGGGADGSCDDGVMDVMVVEVSTVAWW